MSALKALAEASDTLCVGLIQEDALLTLLRMLRPLPATGRHSGAVGRAYAPFVHEEAAVILRRLLLTARSVHVCVTLSAATLNDVLGLLRAPLEEASAGARAAAAGLLQAALHWPENRAVVLSTPGAVEVLVGLVTPSAPGAVAVSVVAVVMGLMGVRPDEEVTEGVVGERTESAERAEGTAGAREASAASAAGAAGAESVELGAKAAAAAEGAAPRRMLGLMSWMGKMAARSKRREQGGDDGGRASTERAAALRLAVNVTHKLLRWLHGDPEEGQTLPLDTDTNRTGLAALVAGLVYDTCDAHFAPDAATVEFGPLRVSRWDWQVRDKSTEAGGMGARMGHHTRLERGGEDKRGGLYAEQVSRVVASRNLSHGLVGVGESPPLISMARVAGSRCCECCMATRARWRAHPWRWR